MADGSVRFIAEDIQQLTAVRLLEIADGDVAEDY
jgi:hypothetical protein